RVELVGGEIADSADAHLSSYARRDWGEYWSDFRTDARVVFAAPRGTYVVRVELVASTGPIPPLHVTVASER
ncbi:hypothetical protein, partial [Klebsiella pneumoniae]|uniref:hypothetical protein n=1 Tax=Klebsiella pneumoniae TaxID=573 RepID=UPI003EE16BED